MSYRATAKVFYGVIIPKNFEIEDSTIENAGFIPVFYGNFICGNVGAAIAIKVIVANEEQVKELNLDFSKKEQEKIKKLELFLKEQDIKGEINWYCVASYG